MDKAYIFFYCGLFLLLAGFNAQAAQIISPATTQSFVAASDTITIALHYQVSAPETATESGLGLRVHYDSSLLTPADISLFTSAQQPVGTPSADSEDFDNNPRTDRYFIVSWIDFTAQWPGNGLLPLLLSEVQFNLQSDLSEVTYIGFSASGTAKNTAIQTVPLALCPKPVVRIEVNTTDITEGQTSYIVPRFTFMANQTIPADCGDMVLNYTVGGTADSGRDYTSLSGSITIPAGQRYAELVATIIDDDLVEADETLEITLQSSPAYQLDGHHSSTLIIKSEDQATALPEVNLSVDKLTVTEGQGGSLLLYAERTNSDLSQPLEVRIELDGTATAGNDFHTFSGIITIPAGRTKAFTLLLLKDDGTQENDETLNISIAPSTAYQRGENSFLQLTIQDDELNQHTRLPFGSQSSTTAASGQHTRQIPSSSQWMLLMMSVLLSGVAISRLRNKHKGVQA